MGVRVPKVDAGTESGLHVAGVYQALLDLEADHWAQSERIVARMKAENADGSFMRRNNGWLLERLKAGEPVVVLRAQVECALWFVDRQRVRLPLHHSARYVRVSADDRVLPVPDRPRSRAVGAVDLDDDEEPAL